MNPALSKRGRDRETAWRPRRLGSRWQFAFFHGLISLGGRAIAYLGSDLVSLYYVLSRPSVRARCHPYLSRRFPQRRSLFRLLDAWRLSRSFARTLVDRAAFRLPGHGGLRTSFAGREILTELLNEGRGLVLVTAHAGAWQLGVTSLGILDHPVGVLTRQEEGDLTQPFETESPGESLTLIDPEGFLGGIPEMLGLLYKGGVVCIMGDRALGTSTSQVQGTFLGDPIRLPFSPYKLASATGAPVAVLVPYKSDASLLEMLLLDVFRVPPDLGRRPEAYTPYALRFTQALERFVDQYPYQFYNFYDLWNLESS